MKKDILLTAGILYSSKPDAYYRTKDGRALFAFSYKYEMGYYDIIIHDEPSFGTRDDSSHIAHWLPSDLSPINKKICFHEGKEPKTLEEAKNISVQYAELLFTYIKTGISIDDQLLSRN